MTPALTLILLMAISQQDLPQTLNVPPQQVSLRFYEGLDGPLFEEARKLYLEKQYQGAANRFLELYNTTRHSAALFLAGNSFYQQNEIDQSISFYRQAISEGLEQMPDVHYNLGHAYYSKYLRDEAIAEFRKVLELTNDQDAMAHYHLGILLDGKGAHNESIAHYRKTIELTSDNEPLARQHLGVAYFMNGDYTNSAQQFEIYLRMVPDDPGAYLNYGIALRYLGKLSAAIEQLQIALNESNDNLPSAHYQLGLIYALQENYPLSLEHYKAAIKQGQTSPRLLEEFEAIKKKVGRQNILCEAAKSPFS